MAKSARDFWKYRGVGARWSNLATELPEDVMVDIFPTQCFLLATVAQCQDILGSSGQLM